MGPLDLYLHKSEKSQGAEKIMEDKTQHAWLLLDPLPFSPAYLHALLLPAHCSSPPPMHPLWCGLIFGGTRTVANHFRWQLHGSPQHCVCRTEREGLPLTLVEGTHRTGTSNNQHGIKCKESSHIIQPKASVKGSPGWTWNPEQWVKARGSSIAKSGQN